jgi:N-acetylglucosaminyldiphosphoundecaprenol N-acetyl-beta-D-mannosaminyltransferase
MNSSSLPKGTILGFPIHIVSMQQALSSVLHCLKTSQTCQVVTVNPEMIVAGQDDLELGAILKNAHIILPDGIGVVWALRFTRQGPVHRLPGIEFAEALMETCHLQHIPIALIGASPEVLPLTVATLKQRFPNLNIVYQHHGFFNTEEEPHIVTACVEARPKVVLVALGVPRQEKWIAHYASLFEGSTFVGVGGSFDVWSGKVQRAPALFRTLNLEWFYRIASQPWRFKRVAKPLPLFLWKVLCASRFGTST